MKARALGGVPAPWSWARERVRSWLHGSPTGLVAVALAIGVGAGAGAVVFRYLILWCTRILTGHPDYAGVGHAANPWLPQLGFWFVLVVPVIGGLVYGPLVEFFASEARGHGVPEVMLAVAQRGGRIRPRVAAIKALASAICIGSGGSVGREGPIVQIGSALGSTLGQVLGLSESRVRLLVACGAAGGISATFNAPIAGVMFALELILRDFEAQAFGVVVLASVAADVVGRAVFGSAAFLALPPFQLSSVWEFALYAGLGVVAALVGVGFIRVLYGLEDLADHVWHGPEWLRPAAGGLALGLLLLALPEMYGVGYPVLEGAIRGNYATAFLLVLLAGKILATSLTIAIGGSGGVFAPSLFMGAVVGTAYGQIAHSLLPGIAGPAGAYGLVGMGAVFAAASRAPITSLLIIFELTGDYQIILPLMFSIALAAPIGHLLSEDTIYTAKLRRRGIDLAKSRAAGLMSVLKVREAMQPAPVILRHDMPLGQVVPQFSRKDHEALPVTDQRGHYCGILTARLVEESVERGDARATAGDLAREAPVLTEDQTLDEAARKLAGADDSGLPVLTADRGAVAGWLTHRDLLRLYGTYLGRVGSR